MLLWIGNLQPIILGEYVNNSVSNSNLSSLEPNQTHIPLDFTLWAKTNAWIIYIGLMTLGQLLRFGPDEEWLIKMGNSEIRNLS